MKVQDVMTKYVKSCQLEASLAEAAVTMWEGDCGALPHAGGRRRSSGGHDAFRLTTYIECGSH